jgi:hypothetical protein
VPVYPDLQFSFRIDVAGDSFLDVFGGLVQTERSGEEGLDVVVERKPMAAQPQGTELHANLRAYLGEGEA